VWVGVLWTTIFTTVVEYNVCLKLSAVTQFNLN